MYAELPDVVAAVAGLHAIRYDAARTSRSRAMDTTLLGGAALVMSTAGSSMRALPRAQSPVDVALQRAERDDPPSVLSVVTAWEDAWRRERGDATASVTSVAAAIGYLVDHADWAAQRSEWWLQCRAEIDELRGALRMLTGRSSPPVPASQPCPYCGGVVVQRWTDGGLSEERICEECGTTWPTEAHFLLLLANTHRSLAWTHPDQLVTLADAKRIFRGRCRPNLLSTWVSRGVLRPVLDDAGAPRRNVRGEWLFRLGTITIMLDADDDTAARDEVGPGRHAAPGRRCGTDGPVEN